MKALHEQARARHAATGVMPHLDYALAVTANSAFRAFDHALSGSADGVHAGEFNALMLFANAYARVTARRLVPEALRRKTGAGWPLNTSSSITCIQAALFPAD